MDGLILGLDLCDGYTQLSCWGREENWTLPTAVCRQKDGGWLIGETAYATALAGEGSVTDKLIRLVLQDGSDTIYGVKYRAVDSVKMFFGTGVFAAIGRRKDGRRFYGKRTGDYSPEDEGTADGRSDVLRRPVKDSKISCSCDQPHRGVHVFCAEPDQGCVEQPCGII